MQAQNQVSKENIIMEARAYARHVRIAPRKVQIVMDLIRNKPVNEAVAILQHTPKAACEPLVLQAAYKHLIIMS